MAKSGKLYLIPNTLGGETISDLIPVDVINVVKDLRLFAVEEIKSARRLLRKMDREFPIDESTFYLMNKHSILAIFLKTYWLKCNKTDKTEKPDKPDKCCLVFLLHKVENGTAEI